MNARPHARFPVAIITAAFLVALASALSSQPAAPPSLALLSRDGRRALPLTADWRSGIRRARRSGRRLPADGARRVARRGDGFLQRENNCPDARPGARLGRRAAGVATGAAIEERTPLVGAGRIHQPRLVADLRHPARSPKAIAPAGHRRFARAADHGSLRSARQRRPLDHRRHAARQRHGLAGRRTSHDQIRRRRARCAQPAARFVGDARPAARRPQRRRDDAGGGPRAAVRRLSRHQSAGGHVAPRGDRPLVATQTDAATAPGAIRRRHRPRRPNYRRLSDKQVPRSAPLRSTPATAETTRARRAQTAPRKKI